MSRSGYHYEYLAETDNLCWGRMKITQGRNRDVVAHEATNSGKGCFIIRRVRVKD